MFPTLNTTLTKIRNSHHTNSDEDPTISGLVKAMYSENLGLAEDWRSKIVDWRSKNKVSVRE